MLKQVAPSLFEGTIGETVRIFAEASNNGGAEAATFSYAETPLEPVEVLNHPGCEFQVEAGSEFCRTLVEFDTGSPTASYELFEEVGGIPFSLGIVIDPLTTGPIVQFQIDGELGAMELAMAEGEAEPVSVPVKKTAKKAVKKTVKKAAKKSVAKRVVKERTARKAIKKIARKAARKATRKAATKAVKKTARKRSK